MKSKIKAKKEKKKKDLVSKRKQIPKDSKNTETPETYRFFFGNFFRNSIRIEIKAEGP